ncbi:MAG TPA: hypothetical protein DCE77_05745, partial [Methylophaga sp.]|nr:hypothetical protein [Methylophaga sp.]
MQTLILGSSSPFRA